jgi:flagellar motor protein MotB
MVYFETESTELTADAKATIDQFCTQKNLPSYKGGSGIFMVIGHADPREFSRREEREDMQRNIASQRALRVANYILEQRFLGGKKTQLHQFALASSAPCSESQEDCRDNPRVELVLYYSRRQRTEI